MSTTTAAVPAAPATIPAPTEPLWPQSLPVVGLTGPYESGKTLWIVTIRPKRTKLYDTEKSSQTYDFLNLGHERVDVQAEMLKIKDASGAPKFIGGYKPVDLFLWWWADIKKIEPGRYDVIGLDTVSEIESGLADWVYQNPSYFGRSAAQYAKMEALMWGDVKELWKSIISDLATRCQTFAFTAHLREKWVNQKPSGKMIPKGKSTLMELASLYIQLDRTANEKGEKPPKPSGVVLKSRLVSGTVGTDGEINLVPTLPARLPVATPAAIREFMINPAGARAAKPEELAPEKPLTEDEKLHLQAQIAEANRDTEAYRLDVLSRKQEQERQEKQEKPKLAEDIVKRILGLLTKAGFTKEAGIDTLRRKYSKTSFEALSIEEAMEVITLLEARIAQSDPAAAPATPANGTANHPKF